MFCGFIKKKKGEKKSVYQFGAVYSVGLDSAIDQHDCCGITGIFLNSVEH